MYIYVYIYIYIYIYIPIDLCISIEWINTCTVHVLAHSCWCKLNKQDDGEAWYTWRFKSMQTANRLALIPTQRHQTVH